MDDAYHRTYYLTSDCNSFRCLLVFLSDFLSMAFIFQVGSQPIFKSKPIYFHKIIHYKILKSRTTNTNEVFIKQTIKTMK